MGCAAAEKFFGPTRPFFPPDADRQVSTSSFLGKWLFFAMRLVLLLFLFATLVLLRVDERGFDLTYVTNWSYTIYIVAQILLASCTCMSDVSVRKGMLNIISKITLPLYFTAATAAFMITPVFWIMIYKPPMMYRTVVVHGGTLLIFLVDLLAGANLRFPIQLTVFPVAVLMLYISFLWIRFAIWRNHRDFFWPYGFIDPNKYHGNIGILIGVYLGFAAYTCFSGIVIILLNRIFSWCLPSKANRSFDEEEDCE